MASAALQFGPTIRAVFLERPNRFLVRCRTEDFGVIEAFMPNPGRMWELLLPNVVLHVVPCDPDSTRKTRYTVFAVERDGDPVFLHTHVNNSVARHVIEKGWVPGLEGAEIVRPEITVGRSRFDFLLRHEERDLYLEVKSCTLFGNGVAMFPDAVTARGRRHLLELDAMAREGTRVAVLFLVHTPRVQWFMPDFHTDPAFTEAMLAVRDHVPILPLSVGWTPRLRLRKAMKLLEIPWDHVAREARDRGSYLLILRLKRGRTLAVGALGTQHFPAGYYVYAGSAMKDLSARMNRHLRKRKRQRWHIDYLRDAADEVMALPIRSAVRQETGLVAALAAILAPGPEGFGASDSPCATHLFRSAGHPLRDPAFHRVLEQFRMRPPG